MKHLNQNDYSCFFYVLWYNRRHFGGNIYMLDIKNKELNHLIEIRNLLEFYVRSNFMKENKKSEDDSFTVAEHLFGSLLLAVTCNREMDMKMDLSSVLRRLYLKAFHSVSKKFRFSDFQMKDLWNKEMMETSNDSKEAQEAIQFQKMESELTQFIYDNLGVLPFDTLMKDGAKIVGKILHKDPSSCEGIVRYYFLNYKLMHKVRSGWDDTHWNVMNTRRERVADHIVSCLGLAIASESEFKHPIDYEKVFEMLVLHESGETLMPDVTPFDGVTPEEKRRLEHEMMKKSVSSLSSKHQLLDLLFEFDNHQTKEAKFAYFCDKVEADLQAKIYLEKGCHHTLDDQEFNCVFKNPIILEIVKNSAKNAYDVFYEWDRHIYERDKKYPEFFRMIQIAKDNELFRIHSGVIKKKIHLSEKDMDQVSDLVGPMLKDLYQLDNVDCVFVTNYASHEYPKGLLSFTVVCSGYSDALKDTMTQIRKKYFSAKNFPVQIDFDTIRSSCYSLAAMNPSEVGRNEELGESTIIFDKKGRITEIHDRMKKFGRFWHFYLYDYEPPIDQELGKLYQKNS